MGHSNVQPQLQNITHETFACENPFVSRAQKIMEQELDKKTEQKKKNNKNISPHSGVVLVVGRLPRDGGVPVPFIARSTCGSMPIDSC